MSTTVCSRVKKITRVRHHTSPEGLKGIKRDGAINPGRGIPIGVHVEVVPFSLAKTASTETGAFGKGAFVEFDAFVTSLVKTYVGPRNTAVISTDKPLAIEGSNPSFNTLSWWKFWES
ncbi:MAG: hypothetical protein VSS75_014625 [Candidatus Parabeggiatoa sp.]|nr:hypothetical protein [Candidatus Parabeggiatoa sp.]